MASITRLKPQLTDLIEPDYGLLTELLGLEVLTHEECDNIRCERTPAHRTEAILDLLSSENRCVKFLKALQRTQQQHVVNYITENGGKRMFLYNALLLGSAVA